MTVRMVLLRYGFLVILELHGIASAFRCSTRKPRWRPRVSPTGRDEITLCSKDLALSATM